jgi:prepilin peptidase CpaA
LAREMQEIEHPKDNVVSQMHPVPFTAAHVFAAIFIFLVVWAMVSDASRLIIPNWVCVGLLATYFAHALMVQGGATIVRHIVVASVVFGIGIALFLRNWFGGGDVKLLAAVGLWAGPGQILPLLLIMSVTGVALALVILYLRFSFGAIRVDAGQRSATRLLSGWVGGQVCPYGIAIGLAALLTVPVRFF